MLVYLKDACLLEGCLSTSQDEHHKPSTWTTHVPISNTRGQPDPFHSVRKSSFAFPDGRPKAGHKSFILFGFLHPPWPSSRQTWLSPFGKEIIVFLTRRPPQGWARKGKKHKLWAGVEFFFFAFPRPGSWSAFPRPAYLVTKSSFSLPDGRLKAGRGQAHFCFVLPVLAQP